jgi:hypothetical protein
MPTTLVARTSMLGLGTMAQTDPFHESISVWLTGSVILSNLPAAAHDVDVVHDTPDSAAPKLGGVALEEVDHEVPFQDSASV